MSMSSLHWLSCRDRVFWMGRVVERLGPLPSLVEEKVAEREGERGEGRGREREG